MPVETTEYRGKKCLVLTRKKEDKFPFTFGIAKARLIVKHIDAIRDYVDEIGREELAALQLKEDSELAE